MYTLTTKTVKGRAYYIVRLTINGKRCDRSLGRVDQMSYAEAKLAAIRLAENPTAAVKQTASPSFIDILPLAMEDIAMAKQWKNEDSRRQWEQSLSDYAVPILGNKPVAEISLNDVHATLKRPWLEKPETASRVRSRIEAVLDWCTLRGLREGANPATWRGNLSLLLPPKTKVRRVQHHAAPTLDELRVAISYCRLHPSPVSALLLFTAATVCRVSEARLALKEEINEDLWVLPIERMKVEKDVAHRVPLSLLAREALAMGENHSPYLFSANGRSPVALDSPRLKLNDILKKKVTTHGIRSTFRDWAAREGVEDAVAEKCLAHAWGDKTTQAYYRDDLIDRRREVLDRWAQAILEMPDLF